MYPVIFGDLNQALAGSADGYHPFNGDKQRLVITTPAVGSTHTIQIVPSGAPALGDLTITYKGEPAYVLWNATNADISTALNNLSTIVQEGLTVDVVGTLAGAVTLTFNRKPSAPLGVIPNLINAGGIPLVVVRNVSAEGSDGWFNNTYDVSIYSLYFRSVHQNKQKLYAMDLV